MARCSLAASCSSVRGGIGSSTSSSIRTTCWPRAVTRVLDVVGRAAATTMCPSLSRFCASSARNESPRASRSEEHTSELQSQSNLVCRLLLEKKKNKQSQSQQQRQRLTRDQL